jgi:hypothetical protein
MSTGDPVSKAALWARAMERVRTMSKSLPENLADEPEDPARSPDPTGRWTVKPVRGYVPDAPIDWCLHFPRHKAHERCDSPPVDVAKFQAKTIGLKMRGSSAPRPTMSRGDLRTTDGSTGTALGSKHVDDPELTLPPLQLDPLPVMATTYSFPTNSAKPEVVTDDHILCRKERDKLHTRTIRAEHKLVKAEAEIERLKAELEKLARPKRTRKAK